MPDHPTTPPTPTWADARTAVVSDLDMAGPVVERGDRLHQAILDLLRVSRIETLGDLRAAAQDVATIRGICESYEETLTIELEDTGDGGPLDPGMDVRASFRESYVDVIPAPWIVDGPAGWELDELIARFGRVSGASPGGHADWLSFELSVDELAAQLRELGFTTVRVPPRVFGQLFAFPVDEIHLDEGELLVGSPGGDT